MEAPSKSWSIHTRPEIIAKYQILERVGSGAYSDVYRARRLSDGLTVALKEVHDYQSAFREIEALRALQNCPNVVVLLEYFWREEEDAVLVLEFLRTDLATVVREAKKSGGLGAGEAKRWMMQILGGLDACHRSMVVHRDLKPSNLLISEDGVLKIADFGQARILLDAPFTTANDNPHPYELNADKLRTFQPPESDSSGQSLPYKEHRNDPVLDDIKSKEAIEETDKESNVPDGDTSCLATCTTSEFEDDPFKGSYSYEAEEGGEKHGSLTSCVGTRWYRAPELLYGSTDYGLEVDLWSLGCIFAELLNLDPLFPGASDIDQLGRIFSVLGNLNEESWPGCVHLPDYRMISFNKVEEPIGLEAYLPKCSPDGVSVVKKLVCYDPANRATAMELLQDKYFNEQPVPVPVSELRVPLTKDEDYPGGWNEYNDGSGSDFDEFFPANVTTTSTGFSIKFPEN